MTWYRSQRDSGVWVSIDAEDIEEMRTALKADWAACSDGFGIIGHGPDSMPNHNTGHVTDNGVHYKAYTYRCRSGSRWFNPQTRQMEGHAHCTCDGCF